MLLRRPLALTTSTALAGILLGLAVTAPPAAASITTDEPSTVPSNGTFVVEGHGWGHGRGMSQYGAQGGASLGKTADQITAFYYPGTARTQRANALIRVLLQADTGGDTQVYAASGLTVTDLSTGTVATLPAGPTRWRSFVDSAGLHVQQLVSGTWQPYALGGKTVTPGPLQFGGPAAVRLVFPDGTSRDYRGAIRSVRTTASTVGSVNVVSEESYLLGVVPRESSSSWQAAALQAQSIAARTYADYKRVHAPASQYFDICDSTQCQVYGGAAVYDASGQRTPLEATSTSQAVNATAGVIRTYQGAAIFSEFSASNGGWSTDGGLPYLIAQRDDWDGVVASSVHSWRATVTAAQLQARYPSVGTLKRLRVTQRDGNGEWGGRVQTVVLEGVDSTGAATSVTTTGAGVYNAHSWPASSDGLRSSWWHITVDKPIITASVAGPPVSTGPPPAAGAPGPVFADGRTVVVPVAGSTPLRLSERNTGNVTWPTGTSSVRLGTSSPRGAASPSAGAGWLSSSRPSGLTSPDTAPGAVGTFGLTLYGNNRPVGLSAEAFEPLWEGRAWMGAVTPLTVVRVDPSASRLAVTDTFLPSSVALTNAPTGTTTMVLRLRNVGGGAWTVGKEALGTTNAPLRTSAWPGATTAPPLAANITRPGQSSVYPGEVGEWRVPLSAARHTPGTYNMALQAKGPDGVPYGRRFTVAVKVDAAVFSGTVTRQSGPLVVPSQGSTQAFFEVRNTGNVAWPVNGPVRSEALAAGGSPSRATSWLNAGRPSYLSLNLERRGATEVRPGERGRFLVELAGNGRGARTTSEPFGVVWESWARLGLTVTLTYRVG
jgi:SpoIID/LytB domain protein